MGSESNNNHSEKLRSSISEIIYLTTMRMRTTKMKTMAKMTRTRVMLTTSPIAYCPLVPLLPFASHSPAGCRIASCLRLASPFITQLPQASILNPSSLFSPAGCRIASLRTASASQRAAASRLAVSSLSPMRRCSCRRCAGVFAIVEIVIVTLGARRQAGIIALVVIFIDVYLHRRC